MLPNLESRLKSCRGQDRSVTRKLYARTTDKSTKTSWIYSLLSRYNLTKRELTYGIPDRSCPSQIAYLLTINEESVVTKFSLIDLEVRQDDRAQAKAA